MAKGDVLWITLRDCKTLAEALQPFERAMKNSEFHPGQKVAWDLTLQHTVLTVEEDSRGVDMAKNIAAQPAVRRFIY